MNKINHKTIMITAACNVIGRTCSKTLAAMNANLLLCDHEHNELLKLAQSLQQQYKVNVNTLTIDETIEHKLSNLPKIDILINNFELSPNFQNAAQDNVYYYYDLINTGTNDYLPVIHTTISHMLNQQDGQIINIATFTNLLEKFPQGAYALYKKIIRETTIIPKLLTTNLHLPKKLHIDAIFEDNLTRIAADIASAIYYCATRPKHIVISEMEVLIQAKSMEEKELEMHKEKSEKEQIEAKKEAREIDTEIEPIELAENEIEQPEAEGKEEHEAIEPQEVEEKELKESKEINEAAESTENENEIEQPEPQEAPEKDDKTEKDEDNEQEENEAEVEAEKDEEEETEEEHEDNEAEEEENKEAYEESEYKEEEHEGEQEIEKAESEQPEQEKNANKETLEMEQEELESKEIESEEPKEKIIEKQKNKKYSKSQEDIRKELAAKKSAKTESLFNHLDKTFEQESEKEHHTFAEKHHIGEESKPEATSKEKKQQTENDQDQEEPPKEGLLE